MTEEIKYIVIPTNQVDKFTRKITRYEEVVPVEVSDGRFILPTDVLIRIIKLNKQSDFEYFSRVKMEQAIDYLKTLPLLTAQEVIVLKKTEEISAE